MALTIIRLTIRRWIALHAYGNCTSRDDILCGSKESANSRGYWGSCRSRILRWRSNGSSRKRSVTEDCSPVRTNNRKRIRAEMRPNVDPRSFSPLCTRHGHGAGVIVKDLRALTDDRGIQKLDLCCSLVSHSFSGHLPWDSWEYQ